MLRGDAAAELDRQERAAASTTLTEEIIRIEEQRRPASRRGRKALFLASADSGDAMSFIIGAEIYDHLEKVVDRFEDVSNEINALVIDHL